MMDQLITPAESPILHLCGNCNITDHAQNKSNRDWPREMSFISLCYQNTADFISSLQGKGIQLPTTLKKARVKRQAEYLAGRYCARLGLETLGADQIEVHINSDRSPSWPSQYTGSITHSNGLALAATGPRDYYRSIGVDAEKIVTGDRAERLEKVVLREEDSQLRNITGLSKAWFFTLVFSAKESLYKLLHPEVQRYFGFEAAVLSSVNIEKKTFVLMLKESLSATYHTGRSFSGRYIEMGEHLVTLLYIESSGYS